MNKRDLGILKWTNIKTLQSTYVSVCFNSREVLSLIATYDAYCKAVSHSMSYRQVSDLEMLMSDKDSLILGLLLHH